jgi:PAS domain S-box-containing protein
VNEQKLAIDFDPPPQHHFALGSEPTETIDMQNLLGSDMGKSGIFDLSSIGSTSFGKLLEALPVPVLLIDQWFCIAFLNQSCEKLSTDYTKIKGSRFTDLLPSPNDAARAHTLQSKTMTLLERVFSERRPQRAEAILEVGGRRIWARLHLRSVRLGSDRHIMAIIEDITSERTNQRVNQKDEKELRETVGQLELRVQQLTRELSETEEKLRQESALHEETKDQLTACTENREGDE